MTATEPETITLHQIFQDLDEDDGILNYNYSHSLAERSHSPSSSISSQSLSSSLSQPSSPKPPPKPIPESHTLSTYLLSHNIHLPPPSPPASSSMSTTSSSFDDEEEDELEDAYDTNNPYIAPPVHPILNQPNKYRTLVRDNIDDEEDQQRWVTIAKRSFRGAGVWRGDCATRKEDEEDRMNVDDDDGEDRENEDSDDDDAEVEVIWSTDGEAFQLMRLEPKLGERPDKVKETCWVNRKCFGRS